MKEQILYLLDVQFKLTMHRIDERVISIKKDMEMADMLEHKYEYQVKIAELQALKSTLMDDHVDLLIKFK